ncbi:tumor necrosis factor ligand superfamily member 10 [Elysia marginata]|uniref:Tumor necrosis factor ligand superfamily member 10 n=1 Tax=Elysia marginata TaxID=1093978 RepID=A0AAV4F3X5_9GAST|nr:tumor necrosis factor ligand superfamily member 10 [Elysia marginata]
MQSAQPDSGDDLLYFSGGEKNINKGKNLRWIALFLSFTAIMAAAALGAILVIICTQRNNQVSQIFSPQHEHRDPSPFACLPCVKLLRDPSDVISADPLLKQLDIKVTDGREDCCATSSEQITALLESVMRLNDSPQPVLPSYNVTNFNFSPVSAHKRLYPEILSRDFGIPEFPESPEVCELRDDDPRYGLEHHRGVNITRQGLKILHGGLYYIYASIEFRPQSIYPCKDFKYQTFAAYVEKRSYQSYGSQNILKVSHTCCDQCRNTQETSFTGGVFMLHPGDVVGVKVVGYRLVHFHPVTSYMGLAIPPCWSGQVSVLVFRRPLGYLVAESLNLPGVLAILETLSTRTVSYYAYVKIEK